MPIPICRKGERAACNASRKSAGSQGPPAQRGGPCFDMPPLQMRISRIIGDGGLPGVLPGGVPKRISDPAS